MHNQSKMMSSLEEDRSSKGGQRDPKYSFYFTDMDHTEGSVGGNYYEGQIRVNYRPDQNSVNIASIYLDPKREGYGRLVYLTSLNKVNVSHMDDILDENSAEDLQNCMIMEG